MKLYAGIDLHSSNHVLTVIDESDKKLFEKRLSNDLTITLQALQRFKPHIEGIAVESTFNWYWLVDGLMEAGYTLHLVNTVAVKQYDGLKHTDDHYDAFWLAHLLRLGLLPTGYIYPKAQRGVRDLLRKRGQLVQQRTAQILSIQNQYRRHRGVKLDNTTLKKPDTAWLDAIHDPFVVLAIQANLKVMQTLNAQVEEVERIIIAQAKLKPEYRYLQSVMGIGKILALTIMYETGDIQRFASVGDYVSYCRCVGSHKLSNGKKKGEGNRKNGNKYLAWAFIEAAHFAARHHDRAKRFYQRKQAKRNTIVAAKALAHKLARASYYVMRDQVAFAPERVFN